MSESEDKIWNRNFIILFLVNVVNGLAFNLCMPMVSKYAIFLGATLSYAGLITGSFSTAALFARPIAGVASDRFNKKLLMMVTTFVIGLVNLFVCFAPNPETLLAVRIIHGLMFGICGTTSMALATSYIPRNHLGEGVGYIGISSILGMAIGPAMGIALADMWGIRSCFLATAALMFFTMGCMFLIPKTPAPANPEKGLPHLSDIFAVRVVPMALLGACIMMTNGIVSSYLVLVGESRGIGGIGLFFTLNALVMLVSRPFAGRISDRYGLRVVIIPAFLSAMCCMVLLANANSLLFVLAAALFHSFGYGMAHPALQAASIGALPPEKSGVATSTYYIGADIGVGVGPMLGGLVAAHSGYVAMFYAMTATLMVGLVCFILFRKKFA